MPLYDANHTPQIAPEDAVCVAHAFMTRCRDWAVEEEIPKRLAQVQAGLDPVAAGKLHAWVAWMRFCEHALAELESGQLDSWFTESTR